MAPRPWSVALALVSVFGCDIGAMVAPGDVRDGSPVSADAAVADSGAAIGDAPGPADARLTPADATPSPAGDAAITPDSARATIDAGADLAPQGGPCKFVQVSTEGHTCAVTAAGALWCWGANDAGQVGDLTTSLSRPFPGLVANLPPVAEVAVGYATTCARLRDGGVRCWGRNDSAELGDGAMEGSVLPVTPKGLGEGQASSLSAGWLHAATVLTDGSVLEWGQRVSAPAGEPTRLTVPTMVKGFGAPVATVSCGWVHSCALARDASLWCWGEGDGLGQGGRSSTIALEVELPAGVRRVSAGVHETCAVLMDRSLWCWGRPDDQAPHLRQPFDREVEDVCVGQNFGCALRSDGKVWCWGQNYNGELGDDGPASTGRAVTGLKGRALQLDCASFHACAVLEDGTVSCWGDNMSSAAGTGPSSPKVVPTPVSCPR